MKIKEVEQLTGLTPKAIRLYESKGLLRVSRSANAYREYTAEQVHQLRLIRIFREAGIAIPDIRLWTDAVLSTEELMKKRLHELHDETGRNQRQAELCMRLLTTLEDVLDAPSGEQFDDADAGKYAPTPSSFLALGIDLGTTTISATLVDISACRQVEVYTLPNATDLPKTERFCHEQDAQQILDRVERLLRSICGAYSEIRAIGLTGQMHGIVYVNANGHAVSPLYTWQDTRGDEPFCPGLTYCDEIYRRTGEIVRPGYGFATHFYNVYHNLVPPATVSFCTIMDYVAMRITGGTHPVIHPSNAASLGLFDTERNVFRSDALNQLGLAALRCPEVMPDGLVGRYEGIPVTVAIGDNQASFFGTVRDEAQEVLVNYGTGSQISFIEQTHIHPLPDGLERRPYHSGKYLMAGSALCGGRAYAMLESFFRQYLAACGQEAGSQYEIMNAMAQAALAAGEVLPVRTTFCGTRVNPALRGEITELGEENFTPRALTLGVLQGMADELRALLPDGIAPSLLVASGNAVQKNPAFQQVLSRTFRLPLRLSAAREEAAFGTALYAALFSSQSLTLSDVKTCIP